jgi:hypothetical protein
VKSVQVYRLSGDELDRQDMRGWDVWEKDASESECSYTMEEHCFVERGSARIIHRGATLDVREGDYVVFPVGMTCTWKVAGPLGVRYAFRPPGTGSY